jgi:hypothetical protein
VAKSYFGAIVAACLSSKPGFDKACPFTDLHKTLEVSGAGYRVRWSTLLGFHLLPVAEGLFISSTTSPFPWSKYILAGPVRRSVLAILRDIGPQLIHCARTEVMEHEESLLHHFRSQSLGYVMRLDVSRTLQVSDGASHLEDATQGAGVNAQSRHGRTQEALASVVQRAILAHPRRAHVRVARQSQLTDLAAPGCRLLLLLVNDDWAASYRCCRLSVIGRTPHVVS